MKNVKAQAGLVGLVVTLVIGVVLLVGVLVPITNNQINTVNVSGGATLGFTGTNKTIADNLVTFILIGVLVLISGLAIYGLSKR